MVIYAAELHRHLHRSPQSCIYNLLVSKAASPYFSLKISYDGRKAIIYMHT